LGPFDNGGRDIVGSGAADHRRGLGLGH